MHSLLRQSITNHYFKLFTKFDSLGLMQIAVNGFHSSCPLQHAPNLKKKKKVVVDASKIARRLEKQEAKRRLEPIIIPLDPDSVADPALLDEKRKRPMKNLSAEELERRAMLSKQWSKYCFTSHKNELHQLQIKAKSRQDALRELKKISTKLFEEALKVNTDLFPIVLNGPVDTPPCKDYIPPDQDIISSKLK